MLQNPNTKEHSPKEQKLRNKDCSHLFYLFMYFFFVKKKRRKRKETKIDYYPWYRQH